MTDICPICGNHVEGYGTDKRESSLLRTSYKTFGAIVSPIPFIGSYVYGKLYNTINGDDDQYHRFVCMNCRCSWTTTPNNSQTKIGGDKLCSLFFVDGSYVFGSIEHGCYMTIKDYNTSHETANVYQSGKVTSYANGESVSTQKQFRKMRHDNGYYIGEIENETPNGYGVFFHKSGDIWYGKWRNGLKNGVGFGCDFEGKKSFQGYWENNKQTITL